MEQCCNRTVQLGMRCKGCPHDLPRWVLDRVEQEAGPRPNSERIPEDETVAIANAFARYIMKHEQPPVDPDVIAVREILAEGSPSTLLDSDYRNGKRDDAPEFQAALAAYRKHKEAGK